MIQRTYVFLILSILAVAVADSPRQLQATSITITATRSPQLYSFCSNTDRPTLYRQYPLYGIVQYSGDFSRFFNLDSTVFKLFLDLNIKGINSELQSNTLGYATFIIPAFIGGILLVLLAPFQLVFLCCPMGCCLRKKLQYTKCEKTWPVMFAMVMGAAIIASCIVGMVSSYKVYNGYRYLSCAAVVGVDDALYGALNQAGTDYFAGVSTINAQLQSLNNNLNLILGNLSTISSSGNSTEQAQNQMNSALLNISAIPDPSGGNLTLSYNTPIRSSQPNGTIISLLPAILGSSSVTTSLVGIAYAAMSLASSTLSNVTSSIDTFQSQSSGFASSISKMINDTAKSVALLHSTLLTVSDILVTEDYFSKIYYLEYLVYGIILGLTVLYLLSLTLFACCGKMCCRYMLYFWGFLLFLVALITFVVFLLLGFTSAIFYSGCTYIGDSISNPNTFVTNLVRIGIDSTIATQISTCLPGQSGEIIGKMSGDQNRNYLTNLQLVMTNITTFQGQELANTVNESYVPVTQTVQNYGSSDTLDISDNATVQELKYISNPANFNCSSGNFQFDSWIPSIHQTDNAIPCNSPAGMPNSDNTTCTSTANFTAPTLSCQGCMGTYSLLYKASSQAQAKAMLDSRYAGCTTFNTQLANIWQNYYLIKKRSVQPAMAREYTARQSVQGVMQSLKQSVNSAFNSTVTNLYASSQALLTPGKGLLWGLNCTVLGEDFSMFHKTTCSNTFSYSYFHRIIFMVISFAILLLLCCNTCAIFRRRKEISENISEQGDANAVPYLSPGDPLSNGRLQSGKNLCQ